MSMIRIYPEQLQGELQRKLRPCYILTGNDPLLLQESQDAIRSYAQEQGFTEHHNIMLDNQTDWQELFTRCHERSLFSCRQSLTLVTPETGPDTTMATNLTTLGAHLHNDILLILCCAKLTRAQENSTWYKTLSTHAVLVSVQTPEQAHLPRWVRARATSLNLQPDKATVQLLCYCYEGNLLALAQALERLALLWPDGKLTLPRVESAIDDASHFTAFHWVDALLAGKSRRALHILHQLNQEDSEPVILVRTLQRQLLTLLTIERQVKSLSLRQALDKHGVWQSRRPLFTEALRRLSGAGLTRAIHQLTHIELMLKQSHGERVWDELQTLSLMLTYPDFQGMPACD